MISLVSAEASASNKSGRKNIFKSIFGKKNKVVEEPIPIVEIVENSKNWPIVIAILLFVVLDISINTFSKKKSLSPPPPEEKKAEIKQPELVETEIEIQPELVETPESSSAANSNSKKFKDESTDNHPQEKTDDATSKGETSGETSVSTPQETSVGTPGETSGDTIAKGATVAVEAVEAVEATAKETTDELIDEPIGEPIYEPIDEPIDKSIDETIDETTSVSSGTPLADSTDKPRRRSTLKKIMKKSKRMLTPVKTRSGEGLPNDLYSAV